MTLTKYKFEPLETLRGKVNRDNKYGCLKKKVFVCLCGDLNESGWEKGQQKHATLFGMFAKF